MAAAVVDAVVSQSKLVSGSGLRKRRLVQPVDHVAWEGLYVNTTILLYH